MTISGGSLPGSSTNATSQPSCGQRRQTAWNRSGVVVAGVPVRTTMPLMRMGWLGVAAVSSVTASAMNWREAPPRQHVVERDGDRPCERMNSEKRQRPGPTPAVRGPGRPQKQRPSNEMSDDHLPTLTVFVIQSRFTNHESPHPDSAAHPCGQRLPLGIVLRLPVLAAAMPVAAAGLLGERIDEQEALERFAWRDQSRRRARSSAASGLRCTSCCPAAAAPDTNCRRRSRDRPCTARCPCAALIRIGCTRVLNIS